jgi:hypothetical protein
MNAEEQMRALLRREIEAVLRATAGATDAPAGWWEGEEGATDAADRRRVLDDLRFGRLHWRQAREHAQRALAALDAGDLALAEVGLREAKGLAACALEARMQPKDYADLNGAAGTRGAKERTADRNRQIDEAVTGAEARGLRGSAAYAAAQRAHPELKGMTVAAMRKARGRARKPGQ